MLYIANFPPNLCDIAHIYLDSKVFYLKNRIDDNDKVQ